MARETNGKGVAESKRGVVPPVQRNGDDGKIGPLRELFGDESGRNGSRDRIVSILLILV
jgi:hypothetical protein